MKTWLVKHQSLLAILSVVFICIASWAFFYSQHLTTSYNDAMSHLNVARLVIDNQQPGLSQLGSVWLPLSHILTLPLIWNNFLWHTGLAGSLISMASFVIATIALYKIVVHLTDKRAAGYVGAAAFVVNANLLYLQSTPLTEPLYLALFMLTVLFLIKYLKYNSSKSIIALAIVSFLGILTRYDAWFVALITGIIILLNELAVHKKTLQATLGNFILFLFPIFFAVLLWLGWNLLIFGDPLYSFVGPYSAHAQQQVIEQSSGLITKSNIQESAWAYELAAYRNIGLLMICLGVLGWIVYLLVHQTVTRAVKHFAFLALFSIILFNIIALFLGFSILNLPELGWNPSGTEAGSLFNVRYGILALPFVAVGVGLSYAQYSSVRKLKTAMLILILALIAVQFVITIEEGLITIQDGTIGSSAFVNQDIADAIKTHVKPGEKVIMSTSSYNAVAYESGLDLRDFIHEGVSKEWNGAISEPDKYATWIVMANNNVGEPVHNSLVNDHHSAFLEKYSLVYKGAYASLYKRN